MVGCQHYTLRFEETPSLIHYGKEVCSNCGRFVRWIPHPKNQERDNLNHERLEALAGKPVTEWEREFLLSLTKQGRGFSPKQQAVLDRISKAHGIT